MRKEAFTDSFLRAIYISLAFHVIITVIFALVLFDIFSRSQGYFTQIPLYLIAVVIVFGGLSYWFNRSFKTPVLRQFGIMGGLSVAPMLLFVFSIPATIYFVTGGAEITVSDWSLLGIVTASLIVFGASLIVFTVPSDLILSAGFSTRQQSTVTQGLVLLFICIVALVTIITLKVISIRFSVPMFLFYLALPLISVIVVMNALAQLRRLRRDIRKKIDAFVPEKRAASSELKSTPSREKSRIFNELYFREKYLAIISGDTLSLTQKNDDEYAATIVYFANRTYDLSLLPSLGIIASGEKYSEKVKGDAVAVIHNIEKYYSNPGKYVDMIVQEGIPEKASAARKILVSQRKPQASEVLRLLRDPDPELRRIALAAMGKFGILELMPEVIQALSNPETEKNAYFLLSFFGPQGVKELSESFASTVDNESVSLLKIRLLSSIGAPCEINSLAGAFWQGAVRMKSKGMRYLRQAGFVPSEEDRGIFVDYLSEILCNITRILSLEYAAEKRKCFGLSLALRQERLVNISFAFDLLSFVTDEKASGYLRKQIDNKGWTARKYATEVINVIIDEPLRGPILALTDQTHPERMLEKLKYYYSFREPTDANLVSLILNSDQNISGTWVKANALRCVSEGKLTAETDLLISYLYSSSQLLQEEAARAISKTSPETFPAVSYRLPAASALAIRDIFEDKTDHVALIFEKTRFLALCFGTIPEERLVSLARRMQYSESSDSRHMPGVVPWIIPVAGGRSGLYSLTRGEISDYAFHNPEYLDILILYLEKAIRENVN